MSQATKWLLSAFLVSLVLASRGARASDKSQGGNNESAKSSECALPAGPTTPVPLKSSGASPKRSNTENSIQTLFDEISQLRLELVPESLQLGKRGPRKLIKERGARSDREPALNPEQRPRQHNGLNTTAASSTPAPAARRPESKQSICDKSLAVGTLGYRMLCRHQLAPKPAADLDSSDRQSHSAAAPDSSADVSVGPDATRAELEEPEAATSLEGADELARLRSLLERLVRRGDFRPLPADDTATAGVACA